MTTTMTQPLHAQAALLQLLEQWVELGWLRALDLAFTRFLAGQAPDAPPALLLASALLSHQLGRGHVCLWLQGVLADPYMALSLPPERADGQVEPPTWQPAEVLQNLSLADWAQCLQHPDLVSAGVGNTPLVFDGQYLYLRRYWQYERSVEAAITLRLQQRQAMQEGFAAHSVATLQALFAKADQQETDWQKVACALAAGSGFCIITGGPGTGKTTTVVKVLALLQSQQLNSPQSAALRIRLAAPTGKAAARLKESIASAIEHLPDTVMAQAGLRAAIPNEVITLHRLLGSRPHSRQFKHDARNPLALDVLVVDEASMVDLEMMAALLAALPATARLILLGDQDQLASVEAGSVLGQLCRRSKQGYYDSERVTWLQQVSGQQIPPALQSSDGNALDQHVVMLRKSHRFTMNSGIGQLAAAVNSGQAANIEQVWQNGYSDLTDLRIDHLQDGRFKQLLVATVDKQPSGYGHYLNELRSQRPDLNAPTQAFDDWAWQVLTAHSQFQVLSALRQGPYGVTGLNQVIQQILTEQGLIKPDHLWFAGRPVLVTQNDYRLGLMNGDIGIALPYPLPVANTDRRQWGLRVAFPKNDGSGGVHWLLPSRLLAVETVFALTVHKSQGSEFNHVALILPPQLNPILTRELIYTGITRAKSWFTLISVRDSQILAQAAGRGVTRLGGLFAPSQ